MIIATQRLRSVPILAASLSVTDPYELEVIASCGVKVGNSAEIDLNRVGSLLPDLAERLSAYWIRCGLLWDRYAAGETGLEVVDVLRTLRTNAQTDSRQGRLDLNSEMHSLFSLAVIGPLLEEVLGSKPDFSSILERGKSVGLDIQSIGDTHTVSFSLPSRRPWVEELGSVSSRGEWERKFTLRVSHAPWRDRRVRRLVSIKIEACESWPKP
jgi:hypothetical protein